MVAAATGLLGSLAQPQDQFPALGCRTDRALQRQNGGHAGRARPRRRNRCTPAGHHPAGLGRHWKSRQSTKNISQCHMERCSSHTAQARLRGAGRTSQYAGAAFARRRPRNFSYSKSVRWRFRLNVQVVTAVIEREDRRILIGQRRRADSSPLKWEFPGGKVKTGESLEQALARELREELDVTLLRAVPISRVEHEYGGSSGSLSIIFFSVAILESGVRPGPFAQLA